jgi:hypothetical protein
MKTKKNAPHLLWSVYESTFAPNNLLSISVYKGSIFRVDYQLDLVTPGRYPESARSLKERREERNFRKKPLPLPVNWQRFLSLTTHVSRGILFRSIRAAWRSSSVKEESIEIFFNRCRFSQCLATRISRFFCRPTTDFFAIILKNLFDYLFFPCGSLLTLLPSRIFSIQNIDPSLSSNDNIAFRGNSFNRRSNFHVTPVIKMGYKKQQSRWYPSRSLFINLDFVQFLYVRGFCKSLVIQLVNLYALITIEARCSTH